MFNSFLKKIPICSICQFLWDKNSHCGCFQTPKTVSLNLEMGRNVNNQLLQVSVSQLQRYCQRVGLGERDESRKSQDLPWLGDLGRGGNAGH